MPPAASGAVTNEPFFNPFTDRARNALAAAQHAATERNHDYIGGEHILLGLLADPDSLATRILTRFSVTRSQVSTAIDFIIGQGGRPPRGQVGLTPRAQRAVELAIDEAKRLGHRYIGTEHLLLGLVHEGEGIAAGVLESFGVRLDNLREETVRAMSPKAEPEVPAANRYLDIAGILHDISVGCDRGDDKQFHMAQAIALVNSLSALLTEQLIAHGHITDIQVNTDS
jgi:ATP-dependent Clp protease ATP-binding subunit ClpA